MVNILISDCKIRRFFEFTKSHTTPQSVENVAKSVPEWAIRAIFEKLPIRSIDQIGS